MEYVAAEGASRVAKVCSEINWYHVGQFCIMLIVLCAVTLYYCLIFEAGSIVTIAIVIGVCILICIFHFSSPRFRLASHYFLCGLFHGTGKLFATVFICWTFCSQELQHHFLYLKLDIEVIGISQNRTHYQTTHENVTAGYQYFAKSLHLLMFVPLFMYYLYCYLHVGTLLFNLVELYYFKREQNENNSSIALMFYTGYKTVRYYALGGAVVGTTCSFLFCFMQKDVGKEQHTHFPNGEFSGQIQFIDHSRTLPLFIIVACLSIILMFFKSTIERKQHSIVLNYFVKTIQKSRDQEDKPLSFFSNPGWFVPQTHKPVENDNAESIIKAVSRKEKSDRFKQKIEKSLANLAKEDNGKLSSTRRDKRVVSEEEPETVELDLKDVQEMLKELKLLRRKTENVDYYLESGFSKSNPSKDYYSGRSRKRYDEEEYEQDIFWNQPDSHSQFGWQNEFERRNIPKTVYENPTHPALREYQMSEAIRAKRMNPFSTSTQSLNFSPNSYASYNKNHFVLGPAASSEV